MDQGQTAAGNASSQDRHAQPPDRQVTQHPRQRLGDVLRDQPWAESRRRLAVQPSGRRRGIEGGIPCAINPRASPASTSPAPAVASQGGALPLMMAWPSGRAMTVSGPFSSTTAPARAAAARACDSLSPSMPNSLLNSPAWGVREASSRQPPEKLGWMFGERRDGIRIDHGRLCRLQVLPPRGGALQPKSPLPARSARRCGAGRPSDRQGSDTVERGHDSAGIGRGIDRKASSGQAMLTNPAPTRQPPVLPAAAPVMRAPPSTTA